MKSAAQKTLGSVTVLSLLALLAIAIGAQAAFAGPGSTPAAGTQGRGGVSAPASVSAVVVTTPAAGTQGRGGVAAVSGSATPAAAGTGGSGFAIRVRGGVPRPVSGAAATPASAATTSNFGVWLAVGIAGAVLLVSIVAWASYRRRGARTETSLAAFCSLHPDDAACTSA